MGVRYRTVFMFLCDVFRNIFCGNLPRVVPIIFLGRFLLHNPSTFVVRVLLQQPRGFHTYIHQQQLLFLLTSSP